MDKRDILDRLDINRLVKSFYTKIENDSQLGPIFNHHLVSEEVWAHHFETLTDFWDAVLFQGDNYKGKAVAMHIWVDSQSGTKLHDSHFQNWLDIWHKTVDELFAGPKSELSKSTAISLAQTFYSKIMKVRKEQRPSIEVKYKFEY